MKDEEKKLILFDLDGTLTPSKGIMDKELSSLFGKLLECKKVAVVSGGKMKQFKIQLLTQITFKPKLLSRLYLFPLNATSFYRWQHDDWIKIYLEKLTKKEKEKIKTALIKATKKFDIPWGKSYGKIIEDRESQITFSALGQEALLQKKKIWDPNLEKRKKIRNKLLGILPDFEIKIGGTTSIDILRKGRDKSYCIKKINEILKYKKSDILFIGDALFEEGNDYPIKEVGVDCIESTGPENTKEIIKELC